MNASVGVGRVKLSDDSILKFKILISDVKEAGFSPFRGVQFDVEMVGGISTEFVPEEVKKLVIINSFPYFPKQVPVEGGPLSWPGSTFAVSSRSGPAPGPALLRSVHYSEASKCA